MIQHQHQMPPELRKAILSYLSNRLEYRIISTSAATRALRDDAARCGNVTNQELANYIAEIAVEAGFGVSFDGKGAVH